MVGVFALIRRLYKIRLKKVFFFLYNKSDKRGRCSYFSQSSLVKGLIFVIIVPNNEKEVVMLKIASVRKSYGSKLVLDGIDMTLDKGRIVGLVGKNGAGKTTLFHSILNFVSFEGSIELDGKPLTLESYERIGYLPEERSLMPKLTIKEQVTYLANLKGMTRQEVAERLPQWMERLAVKGKLTDKIKSLSKGNQQKVQLIITLIHEPDLIILDEPFSGLDPVNTALLKEIILAEKERGASIIFSDHVMTNVEELCDDIVMIHEGQVVLNGPINEVRNRFGRTRIFISSDWSQEDLQDLPHVLEVSRTKQGLWKLILDDEAAGREIFERLTQGHYIQTFDQQAPTIDEIFKLKSGGQV